jgi:branched-chain amino acid transport system permease protein
MNFRTGRIVFGICFLSACGVVSLAPLITDSEYVLRLVALVVMWIGMAGAWNIMSGYTGYIDFGPVVYFGIGSYCCAIGMARFGIPFLPATILGGLGAAAVAAAVGVPTLRLRGAYFAIATFAFAEAMRQVTLEFDRVAGVCLFEGSHGITLPIGDHGNAFFLYCLLPVTAAVILTHYRLEVSKFGLGLKAIRDSEDAAETAGVNTGRVKLGAYVLSALFLGLMGAIEAYWISYITPGDAFNVHKTVQMVIMTLLGGMGTILGPVIGASVLTLVYEVLGIAFVEYYLIMVGAIIIGIILLMPRGIIGSIKERLGPRFM